MPDELEDFFRCERTPEGWELQVKTIVWQRPDGAYDETWKTFRHWRTEPDPDRLARARASALLAPRFFRRCQFCGERDATGHMVLMDGVSCMGCAEKHLGIVF